RGRNVTGVQTRALPISYGQRGHVAEARDGLARAAGAHAVVVCRETDDADAWAEAGFSPTAEVAPRPMYVGQPSDWRRVTEPGERSEERRVGEEGRWTG